VCRAVMETSGPPESIEADVFNPYPIADGRDVALIAIRLLDREKRFVSGGDTLLHVTVEGPGELAGLDNGKPDGKESFRGDTMRAYGGMLLAVIRTKPQAGDINVSISGDGLENKAVLLNSKI